MFESLRHPRFRELNRYVDDELRDGERARVAAHLAYCARCRDTVDKVRALSVAARELPEPAAPADLIELALNRRAAGERVILPLTPPGAPRRRSYAVPVAAAAVAILAVAGALTLRAPRLEAARGGLTITPAQPAAGARLSFDYRDMGEFQGDQQLTVRARYRTDDKPYQLTAGVLDRTADGHFRGTITLPDSVVYAAFAVEDPAGRTVDSHSRRLWDVMVHAQDGKPTFDALMARMNDLVSRDWEGALNTARRMTELYPEHPASWSFLAYFERSVLDDSTVMPRHRLKLSELERRLLDGGQTDAEMLAELALYAYRLDQRQESRRLIALLDAEHGWDQVRLQFRLSLLQIHARNDADYLARLENLWDATGGGARLAAAGYRASLSDGEPNQLWTWYRRQAAAEPDQMVPALIDELLPKAGVRERAAEALERLIQGDDPLDSEIRPLYQSVPEYGRAERRQMGRARIALGGVLLDQGRRAEALVQVREAVGMVWAPDALHRAGRLLLANGDTADALHAYARMAADPGLAASLRQTIADDLGSLARTDQWQQVVTQARRALSADIFADRINIGVDTAMVLGDPSGATVSLSQLMTPGATVVAFWSRLCEPAVDSTDFIESVRRELERHGIRMVVVVTEPRSPDLEQALSRLNVPFPVYTDRKGEATRQFVPPGTPTYYVLDGEGRIRFAYSDLDRLVEQAVLLQGAHGALASAAG